LAEQEIPPQGPPGPPLPPANQPLPFAGEGDKNLIPINIEDEMRRSYLDYAMSVIIGRALPIFATASSQCTAASCTA